MRETRKLSPRVLRVLLAAVFLAAGGNDAFGFHDCPHHDALFGHVEVEAHQGEMGHVSTASGSDHSPESDDGPNHGPCTCVGDCQGGSATPVSPVSHAGLVAAPPGTAVAGSSVLVDEPRQRLGRYHLPLANAPPRVG